MADEVFELERHGAHWFIEADPDGRVGGMIARGSPYEWQLLDEVHERTREREVRPGWALDVGSHIGNHALFFAAVCRLRVMAFEPNPEFHGRLIGNVGLNEPLTNWVVPYRCALGAAPGWGHLDRRLMTVERLDPTSDDLDVNAVPIETVDAVCAGVPDDERLYVVKIDVEGAEADVVAGATDTLSRWRPLVYAETHSEDAAGWVDEVIGPLGYERTGEVRMGSTMTRWEAR